MRLLAIVAALLISISPAYAGEDTEPQALKTILTSYDIAKNNPNAVWPGFRINSTSTIIGFFKTNHLYAFDFKPLDPNWKPFPVSNTNTSVYYLPQGNSFDILSNRLDEREHGFINIDGKKTFVFSSMEMEGLDFFKKEEDKTELLQANSAHFIQARFAFYAAFESASLQAQLKKFKNTIPSYDAANSKENIKLLYLEIEALKSYLNRHYNEEALKNYLAIDHIRSQALDKNSVAYEQFTNLLIMPASYVSWKIRDLDKAWHAQIDTLLLRRASDYSSPDNQYDLFSGYDMQSVYMTLTDGFIGPVTGFAADKFVPAWKKTLETTGTSANKQLENHYAMKEEEMKKRLQAAKAEYNFNGISQHIDATTATYFENLATKQVEYKNLTGIEITLDLPSQHQEYSDSNYDSYAINGNTTLEVNNNPDIADSFFTINLKTIDQAFSPIEKSFATAEGHGISLFLRSETSHLFDEAADRQVIKCKFLPTDIISIEDAAGNMSAMTIKEFINAHSGSNQAVPFKGFRINNSTDKKNLSVSTNQQEGLLKVVNGGLQITINNKK